MEEGYIKLNRKMLEWEWYQDVNTKTVFLHCLFKANWKDGRFKGVEIKRGSFVTSLPHLAEETKLSIKNVRTALEHLKSTGEVADIRRGNFRIITVLNYSKYQDVADQTADNRQSIGSPSAAIEEGKNIYTISSNSSSSSLRSEDSEFSDMVSQTETVRPAKNHSADIKKIVDAWNGLVQFGIAPVSRISTDSKRYTSLVARLNQYSVDDILEAIEAIKKSKFLQGDNNRSWVITFDWFVKPSNFPKVLEGNYSDKVDAGSGKGKLRIYVNDSG